MAYTLPERGCITLTKERKVVKKFNMATYALPAGLGLFALIGGSLALMAAQAQNGSSAPPDPKCKINPVQAIKSAQGKVPGRPLQANFELDEGHWVYGVMILNGKILKEVEVDPMTGKAGEVETVTPEGEAKEVQAALTDAISGKVESGKEVDEKNEKEEKPEKPR
jgi:hypothetical protein